MKTVAQDWMCAGAIGTFEAWLGSPAWFREGTSLPGWPAAIPDRLSIADDLCILANITRNGATGAILGRLARLARPPLSPGWGATLAVAPDPRAAIGLTLSAIEAENPFLRYRFEEQGGVGQVIVRADACPDAAVLAELVVLALVLRFFPQLDGADAGVIAGAAVLAGVAALAHKSHHRDDQEWDDSTSYADFERGHRDGLLGHAYHDYSNSARYRDGYESGVRERGYQSGYRGSSYFRGGYESHVSLSDLVYPDRGTAERELRSRGFRQVGGYDRPEGGHSYTWWNGGTRQCVSLNARRGQVEAIQDIYEGHCQ
jgi:hypothetical protein